MRYGSMIASLLLMFGAATAQARDVRVDVGQGITIRAIDTGPASSDAPPLVLVPGWRFSATIWSHQIATFEKDRRVIAIDPRSQGDSTVTTEGDTPEQRAQDLHAVLDKLGVKRFVLVGWSQGVQDVAAYLQRYGTDPIVGLVLVDSTISGGAPRIAVSPGFARVQFGMLPNYLASPRDYTEGMMRAIITRPIAPDEMTRLVDTALRTPTAIGAAMLVADMFGIDRTPVIARIDRPTLIIASPRSFEIEEQRAMATRIPGAQFHIVENAGHVVFVDQPAKFDSLLGDFLAGLPRQG